MSYRDESYDLSVQYDTDNCRLSEAQKAQFDRDLARALVPKIEDFPRAELHVAVERHARSNAYEVRMRLLLARATSIFTSSRGDSVETPFKHCLHDLENRVAKWKAQRSQRPSGTEGLEAAARPDFAAMEQAVERGAYAEFRRHLEPYDLSLRRRIGRWLERYPNLTALLGHGLEVEDVMEGVFHSAFRQFPTRPQAPEALGEWLETLVDPTVKEFDKNPRQEIERIERLRSLLS